MPNIELVGYDGGNERILTALVKRAIRELGLQDSAVITGISAVVVDHAGWRFPYIRICSTDRQEIDRLIAKFKELKIGEDLEYLVITGFIPGKDMTK
ncbi:MAG: hypothetical protein ACM3NH_00295 [Candidatus Saccharibacteria bacterium]